jgi:glycosyltransferase involved in cell wall biosynthesis
VSARSRAAVSPTVVHVLGSVDRGGIEVRTLEVVRRLGADRVSTTMLTLTGREGSLAEKYRAAGARVVPMKLTGLLFVPRFIHYLRREHVHCVDSHVFMASGLILLLSRLARVPNRIAHFQTDGAGREIGWIRSVWYRLMRKLIDVNATQIIGVSPSALEAWDPHWESDFRCQLDVHGVDLDDFGSPSEPPGEIAALSAKGHPVIAHVGRADLATKNREGAILAFAEYSRIRPDGVLVFAGRDGKDDAQASENRERWNDLIQKNQLRDRVLFLGERDDIPSLLAITDLLVVTSTLEGLPGVVVEARAAGVPVLSTALPGAVFIGTILDGVTCLPFGASPTLWAEHMSDLLHHLPTDETRAASMDAIRGSVFDVSVSAERALRSWSK